MRVALAFHELFRIGRMDASRLVYLPTALAFALHAVLMGSFGWGLHRHRRRRAPDAHRAERVSILKPLAGNDDELAENLESFGKIDYPAFEILIGISSASDAALPAARRFVARHPHLARIVFTDPNAAVNPKVAQLIALDREATGSIVVISDSNVRVKPSYLWSMTTDFSDPEVGLVTSVFAGKGEKTLGAALENLQLAASVAPAVVASSLVGLPLTVGKSMAMRRRDLVRLGGFRRFSNVLAEDHVLGRAYAEAGFAVRTSLETVDNYNVDCGILRTIERHTRWAKMRRVISPVGFAFEPLLSPLAMTTLTLFAVPTRASLWAFVAAALVQTVTGHAASRLLRGRSLAWYYAPLELLRAYVAFGCWARAVVSRRVSWRGNTFVLARDTAIVREDVGWPYESRHIEGR